MTPKDDNNISVPAPEDDYSLEEILAEYGGSLEHHLLRDMEEAPAPAEASPAEPAPEEAPPAEPETPPEPPAEEPAAPEPPPPEPPETPDPLREAEQAAEANVAKLNIPHPKPISLEDVVGSTVDAVMEEAREPILPPKRGLFSRKPLEETEQLYGPSPRRRNRSRSPTRSPSAPSPPFGRRPTTRGSSTSAGSTRCSCLWRRPCPPPSSCFWSGIR